MQKDTQNKLFHDETEVGAIDSAGQVRDAQNQQGIELIIDAFPLYLRNSLPEGERYENLLLHSKEPINSFVDAAKNLDEIPGNFSINAPQRRAYTPFPDVPDDVIYAGTTLPEAMFFINSEVRAVQKPSFSGYQDKFTAKAELLNGKLTINRFDPEKEYGNAIVKPGTKHSGIAQNEFVCMRLAKEAGLDVPRTFLLKHPSDLIPARHFCVERFDFAETPPFRKKNMLEFAALVGLAPADKYSATTEELFQCAEKRLCAADMKKFANAYFYGILTGNGDMHVKNFSVFIDENNACRLTPIYDMVNTKVHGFQDMLALPFGESCNPNPKMSSMVEFLEPYIGKDEMYKMARTVEKRLPSVFELVFSQDKDEKIAHSLERSILDCVSSAKAAIENVPHSFKIETALQVHEQLPININETSEALQSQNSKIEAPNMAEVQAAEIKGRCDENANVPAFQKGERVEFRSNKVTLVGEIVRSDAATVTITCGGKEMATVRQTGEYVKAPPLKTEQTKEFAQDKAKQIMPMGSKISFAQSSGVYKGEIIALTPTYAIQKVNREAAVLHRLKDLEQANYAAAPIQEGSNVTITKEDAWLSITPWEREREEKSRGQEQQKERDVRSR